MSTKVLSSPRKVLGDSTNTHQNAKVLDSPSAKRRKLDSAPAIKASGQSFGSSQPKSHFEEEVLEKLSQDIDGLKAKNAEKDQTWERPPLTDFDPSRDPVIFQQIEAKEARLHGSNNVVQLFGVTEAGHSVMLACKGFHHYLYVEAPVGFTNKDCIPFRDYLDKQIDLDRDHGTGPTIESVQICLRESLLYFQGNQQTAFLKITVRNHRSITNLRNKIERAELNWEGRWGKVEDIETFDSIEYILRFMIDTGISGMSWVEAPAGKYTVIPQNKRESTCQIEAYMDYRDLIAHPSDGKYAKMAPLRILSVDIECAGRKGVFPEAKIDPVIQIANVVTRYGEATPFIRNVFVMDTCSSIVNTQVLEFNAEDKMLLAWRDFIEKCDPDVLIGYNTSNFDFPYLLQRAEALGASRFPYWTRLRAQESVTKKSNFSSKQIGTRSSMSTDTTGRIQLDLLQLIQRDHHLRSYTLNSVSAHFLGEQKEDVHHTMITELHNGTKESRRRLAVYCLKDAYLPLRLMDKLMCLVNYTEMARVTGVPFNYLLSRGQQVKFLSQMFRKALQKQLVIPNLSKRGGGGGGNGETEYEGATVIEPTRGYYDVPIATLDFASLYPSIMQAHNLCYTTLLKPKIISRYQLKEGEDYIRTPNNDCFCTAKKRKGLLTEILEELLGARKRAKKELAQEADPFKKAVLNGRQLALKISANSVYGLTGATVGKLPCLEIASSTTAYGRKMIEATKEEVERKYPEAKVIYGDTDSVMVKFGTKDLAEAMRLGAEAAEHVSSKFIRPIKLEFEKVYFPYLLINKKRYAGLYWTKPEKWDKMDTKGIETVRRDNCRLVQTVIETCLRKMLIDRDVPGAEEYVKQTISDLLQNKVDMSKLVITKALTKKMDDDEEDGDSDGETKKRPKEEEKEKDKTKYAGKQAHVELAKRMQKRDAGSAPTQGDRVAYVIIKGAAGAKNFERSEDPLYVLENNLPIDTKYYLENQLAKPLTRIFEPIMGDKKAGQLLTGDHTRSISVAAPTMGGLMKFTKKTQTCMACKKPLVGKHESNGAVCSDDQHRVPELYTKTVNKVSQLEMRFNRLWTQCQRCQESMHCEVICSSKDCPIFYMRMKAKKDVEDASKELSRFDHDLAAW